MERRRLACNEREREIDVRQTLVCRRFTSGSIFDLDDKLKFVGHRFIASLDAHFHPAYKQ
jgi:hypothetical protein